jgi:denticleless
MMQIVTCSDDSRHRIWNVGLEFEDDNAALLRGWAVTPKISHVEEGFENQAVHATSYASKAQFSHHGGTPDRVCSEVTLSEASCLNCNGKDEATSPCTTCACVLRRKSPRIKRKLKDLLDDDDDASCSFSSCGKPTVLSPVREGNRPRRMGLGTRARKLVSPCRHSVSCQCSTGDQQPDSETEFHPILSSPTLNLPNYVLDGTSPHHHCSPNTRLKENVDWLTKLRKEKTTSVESETNSNIHITPKRRLSRSRSLEANKGNSPKGNSETLWRFFRVAGKATGEALNCSATQGESSPQMLTVEPSNHMALGV